MIAIAHLNLYTTFFKILPGVQCLYTFPLLSAGWCTTALQKIPELAGTFAGKVSQLAKLLPSDLRMASVLTGLGQPIRGDSTTKPELQTSIPP